MNNEYNLHFVVTSYSALKLIKQTKAKNILISYYYLRKDKKLYDAVLKERELNIVIDSGLFSFASLLKHKVTDKDIKKYFNEYKGYIERNYDCEAISGFFELDFDLIDKDYHTFVKPMQEQLLSITDKIILICQKGRTTEDIIEMCNQNVKCIAIPFASQVERKHFDYNFIIDLAHEHNKRIHLLGCTDQQYLNNVEQSDSSTWARASAFGEQNIMVGNELKRFHWRDTDLINKDDNNQRSIDCVKEFIKLEKLINEKKQKTDTIKQMRLF